MAARDDRSPPARPTDLSDDGRDMQHGADGPDGLDALPGLARIAVSAWWHTTGWALNTSLRASRRIMVAAVSPEKAADLVREVRDSTETVLAEALRLTDLADRVNGGGTTGRARSDVAKRVADVVPADVARRVAEVVPSSSRWTGHGAAAHDAPSNGRAPANSLRSEGEELLRKSRDVHYEEDGHPAYERILSELAPDEGRILRLLLLDGPQPAVDVRTGGPLGLLKSRLIAPGLSMIGARAGCRYVERVPSYLNNLFRLGLVWFSRETLRDPMRYQVLEAQPDVLRAAHSVSQAKVVRRSIHLTPFGEDFCRMCLTPDVSVLAALPAHSFPPDTATPTLPPGGIELDDRL
ncbi:MAG: Abi-alpha family protein [Solirubrobacteraceae bacterium]